MKFIFNKSKSNKIKYDIWEKYLEKKTSKDYLTMYIDIPFCKSKCKFCQHNTRSCQVQNKIFDNQIDMLESQMIEASKVLGSEVIKATNFGGGSPSLLAPFQLKRILEMIEHYWDVDKKNINEHGFEAHPLQLTDELIDVINNSFINRMSLGVQSLNKKVLKAEKRGYISEIRIKEIIDLLRPKIKQINVDLLTGLLNSTPEILVEDVEKILNTGVDWLTIYKGNPVRGHRNHRQIKPIGQWEALGLLNKESTRFTGYEYIGTKNKKELMDCNRFYKKDRYSFIYSYNPAPIDYNNLIGFSVGETQERKASWSYFIPVNKAYENHTIKGKEFTHFYSVERPPFRPHWKEVYNRRKKENV